MTGIYTISVKLFHDGQRTRGTAHDNLFQGVNTQVLAAQVIEQIKPNRRHARRHRNALLVNEGSQCGAITHFVSRHHHFAARNGARIRIAPGVNVKHGHNGHYDIAPRHTQSVWYEGRVSV